MNIKEWFDSYWKDTGDDVDAKRVERIISLVKKGSVLDVGCGTGVTSAKLMEKGLKVTAVDFSKNACDKARKKGVKVVQADVEAGLPFKDETFDNVIMSEVLGLLYSPAKALIEAERVLSRNGQLIVSVPNIAHWRYRMWLACGRFPYIDKIQTDQQNIRFFTLQEIKNLLSQTGFRVQSVEGYHSWWSPLYDRLFSMPMAGRLSRRLYPVLCSIMPSLFADKFVITASKSHK
jgi:methionine biosynthesis protein MetW